MTPPTPAPMYEEILSLHESTQSLGQASVKFGENEAYGPIVYIVMLILLSCSMMVKCAYNSEPNSYTCVHGVTWS